MKFGLLDVTPGPVVNAPAATEMAEGAMRVLGSSVGLAVTGVAGPAEQDDVPVGTVFVAVAIAGAETITRELRLPGQRDQIRQFAVIGALDLLRRQLVLRGGPRSDCRCPSAARSGFGTSRAAGLEPPAPAALS